MMNKDMLTPQQQEIIKLKGAIASFKKYDQKRKKYYEQAMLELGYLRDEVEELQDIIKSIKSKDTKDKKILSQKKKIDALKKELTACKSKLVLAQQDKETLDKWSDDEAIKMIENSTIYQRSDKLKKLAASVKLLTDRLVYYNIHPDCKEHIEHVVNTALAEFE